MSDADVIVIGGGAAGTSTAINLARLGRRVILLEGREPRPPQLSDLHSGEVLSPGSQRELVHLGLPTEPPPDEESFDYLRQWRLQGWHTMNLHWPDGRVTVDRLPPGIEFWQLNRGRFYQALQKLACQAGVEVRTGARVTNLLAGESGPVEGVVARTVHPTGIEPGQYELRAPVTVDASGRNSVVLARLGLREPEPEFGRVAYLFFFSRLDDREIPPGVWQQFWFPDGATTLRGSRLAPGLYRYSFETTLSARQSWLDRFGRLAPYELFLKVLAEQLPDQARRFEAATRLPHMLAFAPIGFRVRQVTHDGLLMVGDAAGYLDPSTGQGIEFALRMGRLAAYSLNDAFQAGRFDQSAFHRYLKGRQAEVLPIVRNLRFYLRVSQRNRLMNLGGQFAPLRRVAIRQLVTPRPALLK